MGELALDGAIKPARGVLPSAALAKERNLKGIAVRRKMRRKQP
jgi:predicted ATPase with chaperone activity